MDIPYITQHQCKTLHISFNYWATEQPYRFPKQFPQDVNSLDQDTVYVHAFALKCKSIFVTVLNGNF